MKVEELLAQRFRDHGIKWFFGIPGGPSLPYMEAFRRAGIEFILTSHEASAAVMADVTARLTGIPGLCHATFGPGAVNLASGVGGALLDRSPVVALTTEMPDAWMGRTAQMNIDHQELFRPVTKSSFRLTANDAGEIVSRTLEIVYEEYPGPVHIGLPSDLAGEEVIVPHSPGKAVAGPHTEEPGSTSHSNERARVLIASARRPLIAAGLTAARAGAGPELLRLLEQCKVPVVVTPMAKDIIPSSHPCYAGVLFHALSDRLNRMISQADLIIGLGYDPVEYNYESWAPDVPLIHFDLRHTDLMVKGAVMSVSPVAGWFESLKLLRSSPDMVDMAAEARVEIRNGLKAADKGFSPVTALTLLREALPENSIVTADVGSHLHLLGQMWEVPAAGKLIMTNGWSSMGFGLPAALAAALNNRDTPVVCITGDGGFLMHAGEIMTARRYGLKIIVVVLSDGELNLIRLKQSWKNLKPYGTDVITGPLFGSHCFLGVEVKRVSESGHMRLAVTQALQSTGSTIIEAVVDPAVYGELIVRP